MDSKIELKVGDRVEGVCGSTFFTGTVYEITGYNRGTIKRDDGETGTGCRIPGYGNGWEFIGLDNYKLIETKKSMPNLKEKVALIFKSEPEKSFNKAGITDSNDNLTTDGQTVFLSWLLKKEGAAFKKEVVDLILAEEKDE